MDSRPLRPSNSPAPPSISGKPMADETLVAKGFVSTKVDALRKSSAASGDSHAPHPPSYPRARFERVQTYGDWPAYNAKLYNQPHPRTMSLAPNSVPGKFDPSQHEQQEKLGQRQHQNKPPPSRTLGVRGLQHLWESKGQSYNAIDALQYRSATSSADGAVVDDLGPLTSADSWTTPHNPARKAIPPDSLPLHHRVPRTEDISDGPEISNGSLNESSKADGHGFETSLDTDIPPRKEAGRPAEKGQPPPDRKVPGLNFDFSRHLGARSSFHVTTFDTPKSQSQSSMKAEGTLRRPFSLSSQETKEEHGSCDPSTDASSNSSREYHSMDQAEPGNTAHRREGFVSGNKPSESGTARTSGHNAQGLKASSLPGTLDAATQTDSPDEHHLTETSSVWSDSVSVAEYQGHHMSRHRSSKPVRLERRMRRPAVRKVQVIVSLDGAVDIVMDARLRPKRRHESSNQVTRCDPCAREGRL